MNPDLDLLGNRVVSALFNGGYQGLLVALAVWAGLRFVRGANASTRYAVEFVALLVVAALPLTHLGPAPALPMPGFLQLLQASPAERVVEPVPSPVPIRDSTSPVETLLEESESIMPRTTEVVPSPAELCGDTVLGRAEAPPGDRWPMEREDEAGSVIEPTYHAEDEAAGEIDPVIETQAPPAGSWHPSLPPGTSVALIAVWLAVAGLRVVRLFLQCGALRRLKRLSVPAPPRLAAAFDTLHMEMQVGRSAQCRVSPSLQVPIAVGFIRPAVLVPSALADEAGADLERMLRHELAHVRRRDDWTNLVQQLIRAVLFFHPGVLWLSRRLTLDREIACDDYVIAATRSPRDYALFLAEFAGRTRGRVWAAAPAAWSSKSQLKERISMILDKKRNSSPRLARGRAGALSLVVATIAAVGWYAGPRLAVAQSAAAGEEPPAASEAPIAITTDVVVDVTEDVVVDQELPIVVSFDGEISADGLPVEPLSSDSVKWKNALPGAPGADALGLVIAHEPGRAPAVAVSPPGPAKLRGPAGLPPSPVPVPAIGSVSPVPAAPATHASAPRPVPVPRAAVGKGPAHAYASGNSDPLEKRLERLERLVESLVQRGPRRPGPGGPYEPATADAVKRGRDANLRAHEKLAEQHSFLLKLQGPEGPNALLKDHPDLRLDDGDFKELTEKILENVAREVKEAAKEAERAVAEAGVAASLAQRRFREAFDRDHSMHGERHALEERRRVLQKQIEEIEEQLERVSDELERVDEQFDRMDEHMERIEEEHERIEEQRERAEEERERAEEQRERVREEKERAKEGKEKAKEDKERAKDQEKSKRGADADPSADDVPAPKK